MNTEASQSPSEKEPENVRAQGLPRIRSLPPGYMVLCFVTILSLVLNLLILTQLMAARQVVREAVADAIAMVSDFQDTTLSYTATIDDTIPVNADLALKETIPVPINETLPINASVSVPVQVGPFGSYNVAIPISGTVPVNTTLTVALDQPLHIETTIPVHLDVPIQVAVKDTPLAATLDNMMTRLEALALRLDGPLLFGGSPQAAPSSTSESVP
jgi:hypothetical protein